MLSEVTVTEIADCTERNFPIKTFYSTVTKNCLTFYRQGHCLTVNPEEPNLC